MKIAESRQCLSGVFIVNFEHISQLLPVFLSLTLKKKQELVCMKLQEIASDHVHFLFLF